MDIEKYTTKRLKELVNKRGWSYYKLSQMSGVTQSSISYILGEDKNPSLENLERLCDALGISLSEFFDASGKYQILSNEHRELLVAYERLNDEDKNFIKRNILGLCLLSEKE